ncbi:WD40 repeat-like protein [Amanita rubescens]|nr:WD40 repeat-like protein [Amanita rubescens]
MFTSIYGLSPACHWRSTLQAIAINKPAPTARAYTRVDDQNGRSSALASPQLALPARAFQMSSQAAAVGLPNAVQIKEVELILAKPIGWQAAPVLELDNGTGTSTVQKHFKRGETTLRWVLEDKAIIDAQSEATLRLLRTHRVWPKNKLKLEKEWTLSFHEIVKRDLTNPYIVQTHDPLVKVYFDHKEDPRPSPSQSTQTPVDMTSVSALATAEEARETASTALSNMKTLGSPIRGVVSTVDSANNRVSLFLDKLSMFNDIVNKLATIHPYAYAAWTILSVASKTIIDQVNRDDSIRSLLLKMDEVYTFLTGEELQRIESMKSVVECITHQTLECSYFIREYSKNEKFRTRFIKNLLSGTDDRVKEFNGVFDKLMQEFRDGAIGDTLVVVHRIWDHFEGLPEDLDLNSMPYAAGAGLNTQKLCLEGTRGEILDEITDWINDVDDSAPRLFCLHGTAGSGKSAIAHTIAHRFKALGRLGSLFCFDRNRAAERRHEKIFATIAQDLADCHPQLRKALAAAIHHKTSLRNTPDVLQQWEELIVQPANAMSDAMAGPIVIVIDALDESGDTNSRRHILRILAGKHAKTKGSITNLPPHFRILLTSRPLLDVVDAFKSVIHVRQKSMESIPSTELDVLRYVTDQLLEIEVGPALPTFSASLARESGGLFEWARLACAFVKGENSAGAGLTAEGRFTAIMARSKDVPLLDGMYRLTLEAMFPKDEPARRRCIDRFKSVMAQILGTVEPLPLASLAAMRRHFVNGSDIDLRSIVIPMGALLGGTTDSSIPIRALHASFPDFLIDRDRSGEYFIDVSPVQESLAVSCLLVMENGLRFNICQIPTSYLPNSKIPDLYDRTVKECISPELAYSYLVRKLFSDKELLFWFEALSLLKSINTCAGSLSSLIQWITPQEKYIGTVNDVADAQRFLRLFSGIISFSTPHLYLSALPFSPKNSCISTTFADKFHRSAKIISDHNGTWSVVQGELYGHTDSVKSVAFSPDGGRIVSGSYDKTICLWDAEMGELLRAPLEGHRNLVVSVAFSPDGKHIVSGSYDNTIRLWDAETGEPLRAPLKGHRGWVASVAFSPDGKRIVSGSYDNTIRLWDAETGEPLRAPLEGHQNWVMSVAFSPDGKHIVSGSYDKTIQLWDAETGEPLRAPLKGHQGLVTSVAFSPDSKRIVSGSYDSTIRLWDAETGEPLRAPLEGHQNWVMSVAFSPDSKHVVSGSYDKTVRLWDAETGEPLRVPLEGHRGRVGSVAFSPDGKRIVSGSEDNTIRLWDIGMGELPRVPLREGHQGPVTSVAFSPDGEHIVSASNDNTIRLWDAKTGKSIVSGSYDNTIRLWDAETGEVLRAPLEGHQDWVMSVAFSPDGTCIASGSSDNTIRLWDAKTGEPLRAPLEGHQRSVMSVAFSPDGKCIVSGSEDDTIRLWDTETGQSLRAPLEGHHGSVKSVAFSPDGKHIVSGSDDKTICLWDANTGEPLRAPLEGHQDMVMSVAFLPTGKHIVSGSGDNTIGLWDAETGELLRLTPLGEHYQSFVISVALSTDGKCIASGSDDNTIRLWDEFDAKVSSPTFSSCKEHALHDPAGIFQHTKMNGQGWFTGRDGELLFWVPPNLRHAFFLPGNRMVIPRGVEVDVSRMALGDEWYKVNDIDC